MLFVLQDTSCKSWSSDIKGRTIFLPLYHRHQTTPSLWSHQTQFVPFLSLQPSLQPPGPSGTASLLEEPDTCKDWTLWDFLSVRHNDDTCTTLPLSGQVQIAGPLKWICRQPILYQSSVLIWQPHKCQWTWIFSENPVLMLRKSGSQKCLKLTALFWFRHFLMSKSDSKSRLNYYSLRKSQHQKKN